MKLTILQGNALELLPKLLLWLIPLICLTATAAFLIEPEKVNGVKYATTSKEIMTSEYMQIPNITYMGDIEGATYIYPSGAIWIAINEESLARNWIMRHENCHARQIIEKRERSEAECYVRMLIP